MSRGLKLAWQLAPGDRVSWNTHRPAAEVVTATEGVEIVRRAVIVVALRLPTGETIERKYRMNTTVELEAAAVSH